MSESVDADYEWPNLESVNTDHESVILLSVVIGANGLDVEAICIRMIAAPIFRGALQNRPHVHD